MDIDSILDGIQPLEFQIVTNLPDVGASGVVYINDMNEYVYINDTWACIGEVCDVENVPEPIEIERPRLTNCKNCGAVLEGSKCKYCGTEY